MKILSIDWDYFQDVETETLRECYPEGVDNPTAITETIWRGKYALYGDRLSKVDLLQAEFQSLLQLLSKQRDTCPIMIANSHRHIYDFIYCHLTDKVEITNIDMHHDIINGNDKLDCGNWIRELLKDGVVARSTLDNKFRSVLWIANPTSLDMYGLSRDYDASLQKMLRCLCRKKSISELFSKQYDLIYLARSDTWSPPHLDLYFCQLVAYMKSRFVNLSIEKGIDCPRTYYYPPKNKKQERISMSKIYQKTVKTILELTVGDKVLLYSKYYLPTSKENFYVSKKLAKTGYPLIGNDKVHAFHGYCGTWQDTSTYAYGVRKVLKVVPTEECDYCGNPIYKVTVGREVSPDEDDS